VTRRDRDPQDQRDAVVRTVRRVVVFVVFLVVIGLLYSAYKAFGQALDDAQTSWWFIGSFLPATNDLVMPPLLDIVGEFFEPVQRGQDKELWQFILESARFTFKEAAVGMIIGVLVGLAIAILLLRSKWVERGLLPYVITTQTIPLVAIAPLVIIWGRTNLEWLPFEWDDWMSVSLIATYLTFFPVAVNGLRGMKSPDPDDVELMNSYAASWSRTLWKLRLPASLPYLFPAFRIAATASVVGAIVGEISAGVPGGLGRLILDFAGRYTTGPERLYAAVFGAALLGLVFVGLITLIEWIVVRRRGLEMVR
jgi:NitT/TauT family transport system permease protein